MRRAISLATNVSSIASCEGHPSITPPIAGPWLSPNVVSLNMDPNVLIDQNL
jgi:hypothetical protein